MQRAKRQLKARRALQSRERRRAEQQRKRAADLGQTFRSTRSQSATLAKDAMIDSGTFYNLKVKKIPRICGVGVFTTAAFNTGDLLVRYFGETIPLDEGVRRETQRRKGVWKVFILIVFLTNKLTASHTARDGGHVFFAATFAVDPGKGDHLSHKINHSRRRPNARSRIGKTSDGTPCILIRAMRVSASTWWRYPVHACLGVCVVCAFASVE